MLGVHGKPKVSENKRILPLVVHGGIKAMSIEFFLEGRDQAVVWRGPMLHKAIRQFLEDLTEWAEPRLPVDRPAARHRRRVHDAGPAPAAVALRDRHDAAARRAAGGQARRRDRSPLRPGDRRRDREHVRLRDPHGRALHDLRRGWRPDPLRRLDVPLLGKIPLQEELRVAADNGTPLVLEDPDAPASQALFHAARGLIAATPQELAGLQPPARPDIAPPSGVALPMAR